VELRHYPYRFVQKIEAEGLSIPDFLKYRLLYSFKSSKSHQWYWVWIEVYDNDFYALKFHLKSYRNSPEKYNVMTGLNEARPVINTCIAIMQEIANINVHSSFGFIGADMANEEEVNTKRFRVYKRFMVTYFGTDIFEHYFNMAKSTYMLIRKSELAAHPDMLEKLEEGFKELYPYFE
jgi:hypothetical protein